MERVIRKLELIVVKLRIWINSDLSWIICSTLIFTKRFLQHQPFIFTKPFSACLAHASSPATSLPSDHLLARSVFPNIHSSLNSWDRRAVNCTFFHNPIISLLSRPSRCGWTWSQEVIALASNSCHTWLGMLKGKLCTAEVIKNTNRPSALPTATFGSGGCFVTNRINKVSWLTKLHYRVNEEKKNSCAARLYNWSEMKSDVDPAETCGLIIHWPVWCVVSQSFLFLLNNWMCCIQLYTVACSMSAKLLTRVQNYVRVVSLVIKLQWGVNAELQNAKLMQKK